MLSVDVDRSVILEANMFATPDSGAALMDWIEGAFPAKNGQRMAAIVVMGMTWNLAVKAQNALNATETDPLQELIEISESLEEVPS